MGHSRPLFLYFRLFDLQLVDKVCRCWDSNRGSLVSEATALPTEPPPLPGQIRLLPTISTIPMNFIIFNQTWQPKAEIFHRISSTTFLLNIFVVYFCFYVHPLPASSLQSLHPFMILCWCFMRVTFLLLFLSILFFSKMSAWYTFKWRLLLFVKKRTNGPTKYRKGLTFS